VSYHPAAVPAPVDLLRATYEPTLAPGETAREKAKWIAYEQTVELPPGVSPRRVERELVARIGESRPRRRRRAQVTFAFSPRLVDGAGQLLNVLFGNVSMQSGIRLVDLEWPRVLLRRLPGPALGIAGVRAACGVAGERALCCAALKPVGLGPRELARRAGILAAGGIDLLKEDQGLGDQPIARFRRGVERCQKPWSAPTPPAAAVYLPHATGGGEASRALESRARPAAAASWSRRCSPASTPWPKPRAGGASSRSPTRRCRAVSSAAVGIAPRISGRLFCAGADSVVFNAGGRARSLAECLAVAERLRRPLAGSRRCR
jgi:ribulose-bisphosphate carboxylase large chain